MKNMRRAALVGVAVVVGGVLNAPSASAQMAGTARGVGSYAGVPSYLNPFAPPTATSMQFNGLFSGLINGLPGTCSFRLFASGMEGALTGSGSGAMECSGTTPLGAVSATCALNYSRSLSYVTFTGGCLGSPGPIRMDCLVGFAVTATIDCEVS